MANPSNNLQKIGPILFEIPWRQTDRQTNRWTDRKTEVKEYKNT